MSINPNYVLLLKQSLFYIWYPNKITCKNLKNNFFSYTFQSERLTKPMSSLSSTTALPLAVLSGKGIGKRCFPHTLPVTTISKALILYTVSSMSKWRQYLISLIIRNLCNCILFQKLDEKLQGLYFMSSSHGNTFPLHLYNITICFF